MGMATLPGEAAGQILLVDDEEMILKALTRLLSAQHIVKTFSSSREALEQFCPGRYDLAIIDLTMPELTGDQLAAQLRSIDPMMQTVLFTGNYLEWTDPRLAPFDFYVEKPDFHRLIEVVGQATALRQQTTVPHSEVRGQIPA